MFSPCCRGRLTERFVACKVVAPLLQGLRALHSQRVIHRSVLLHCDTVDVAPAHLMQHHVSASQHAPAAFMQAAP